MLGANRSALALARTHRTLHIMHADHRRRAGPTVPGPRHRARPTHRARPEPPCSTRATVPGPTTVLGLPTSHALTLVAHLTIRSGFWVLGQKQKTQGSENSRGCGRCGEARRPSQARLLHLALLRLSKGCGQPRRVRAFPLARARRARLSIARHRPQPRGFRGNALRLGSHHVSAEVCPAGGRERTGI